MFVMVKAPSLLALRPEATLASMDSVATPVEEVEVQAIWTDCWACMAESALSSRAEAVCSPRGVDATAAGVGADAVDAPLDGLADVEAAGDVEGVADAEGVADTYVVADVVTVAALPAAAPLLPPLAHPASAARTTSTAAGAS